MKKYILTLIGFFILNFGGLWLGNIATGPGVVSDWYTSLNQAPWTPPGWVFGLAWTIIGATFSVFMTNESEYKEVNPIPIELYTISLIHNILWNFLFFGKYVIIAGIVITCLSIFVFLMTHYTRVIRGWKSAFWIMPYFIWLMIATSLNWYIVIMN